MEDLMERFWNWKDAMESKGLKVNTRKTKLMVSRSKEELFKNKIDPCKVCGRIFMANSVLCAKCENWVHGKCAKIMEGTVDTIEKLCYEVETMNGFCYLRDRLNASGGCEATFTARVRIDGVRFRKCEE